MKKFAAFLWCVLASACVHAQCVTGTSGVTPAATITFTAPTLNTDNTAIATPLTYNLYQSTTPGAETKKTGGIINSPVPVTIGLQPNTTYYWKLSVVDAKGVESALSNEVCKIFPGSAPMAVTITVAALAPELKLR